MENKKIQLATTETLSSNYAGEAANMFISAALLTPTTIANGGVEVVQNVKYKYNVPNVNLSGIVQDATCDFTDNGTITIEDRVLTTEKFEVNMKLCKSKYRPLWQTLYQSGRFTGSFEQYLIALVAANVAASREEVIWQGANATSGEFDGFETLLQNDPNLPAQNNITGSGFLDQTNIIEKLGEVRDAAGKVIYNMPGFAIRISTAAKKAFIAAQSGLGYKDLYHEGSKILDFQGIPLIHCAGLSDAVMIATGSNVLWYGIEDLALGGNVRVIDQSAIDGSDNVHVVMEWGDGIQYGNVSDIIVHGLPQPI